MSVVDEATDSQAELRARIDDFLDAWLRERIDREAQPQVREALRFVHAFTMRGGKRVRPLFCYWGWRGAGGAPADPDVVAAAAALELFHTAALIHDDLVDASDLRRGRPSMHVAMSRWHAEGAWRGESAHFGRSGALLAGNACLVWSEEIFHGLRAVVANPAAREAFALLRTSAVYGEFLDLLGEARGSTIEGALSIVRHKTAGYTVRYPLQIGAALAGAEDDLKKAYSVFGLRIGEAFQLRDDLIGTLGSAEVTGKAVADDARQGKPTVLVAAARELADATQRARLDRLYGAPDLRSEQLAEIRRLIKDTGAPGVVEQMIADRHREALEALRAAPVHPTARQALELLAAASLHRDH